MNRKSFIKTCGFACVGAVTASSLLQSCFTGKSISGIIIGDDMVMSVSDFEVRTGTETGFKKFVVLHNDLLKFPICVYRHHADEYSALWMQCSHQGAELQVFGDKLQCPAHGSEFSNRGLLESGPAIKGLRTFPVTIAGKELKISLKAI